MTTTKKLLTAGVVAGMFVTLFVFLPAGIKGKFLGSSAIDGAKGEAGNINIDYSYIFPKVEKCGKEKCGGENFRMFTVNAKGVSGETSARITATCSGASIVKSLGFDQLYNMHYMELYYYGTELTCGKTATMRKESDFYSYHAVMGANFNSIDGNSYITFKVDFLDSSGNIIRSESTDYKPTASDVSYQELITLENASYLYGQIKYAVSSLEEYSFSYGLIPAVQGDYGSYKCSTSDGIEIPLGKSETTGKDAYGVWRGAVFEVSAPTLDPGYYCAYVKLTNYSWFPKAYSQPMYITPSKAPDEITISIVKEGDGLGRVLSTNLNKDDQYKITPSNTGINCGTVCSKSFPYDKSPSAITVRVNSIPDFGSFTSNGPLDLDRSVDHTISVKFYSLYSYLARDNAFGNFWIKDVNINNDPYLPAFLWLKGFLNKDDAIGSNKNKFMKNALIAYQKSVGIIATGTFDPLTREKAKADIWEHVKLINPFPTGTTYTLNTTSTGDGSGKITGVETRYLEGSKATITAVADDNSVFVGWEGQSGYQCSEYFEYRLSSTPAHSSGVCTLTMDSNKIVGTIFALKNTLATSTSGTGSGKIIGSDSIYNPGLSAKITAVPDADSVFTGWSGSCTGTAPTCDLQMNENKNAIANFNLKSDYTIIITASTTGIGGGKIVGLEPSYQIGDRVKITAVPDEDSYFDKWINICTNFSSAPDCSYTAERGGTVVASFVPKPRFTFKVKKIGTGSGEVNGLKTEYVWGREARVTAVPASNSTFKGWSGIGCYGTNPICVIDKMYQNINVTATFDLIPPPAAIAVNGNCGTANNSCTAGTTLDVTDSSTQYLWSCNGSNGGMNSSCTLPKAAVLVPINGACGKTNNTCTAGTLLDTADESTIYLWKCNGQNGGLPASCLQVKP